MSSRREAISALVRAMCGVKSAAPYTVAKGDNPYTIAKRYGTTASAILAANPGVDPRRLRIGQRIMLPPSGAVPPQKPTAVRPAAPVPQSRPATPRGAYPGRLNNPGNMRSYGVGWLGEQKGVPRGQFTRFDTPENGLRAMIRNLETIGKRNGSFTLNSVIPVYSPKSENDVAGHISRISRVSGIRPDAVIDPKNIQQMADLARGVVQAESGKRTSGWFTASDYATAARRALRSQ